MSQKTIAFISFDVETDGNNPYLNNMLSIGMIAITIEGSIIWKYETGFLLLEGHEPIKTTMDFWANASTAWDKIQALPKITTQQFYENLSADLIQLNKNYSIKFAAKPANFDWMFLKCYYEIGRKQTIGELYGTNDAPGYDIGFKCLDISEAFNCFKIINKILGNKSNDIETQLSGMQYKFAHDGLYDATCQGFLYIRLLNMFSKLNTSNELNHLLANFDVNT